MENPQNLQKPSKNKEKRKKRKIRQRRQERIRSKRQTCPICSGIAYPHNSIILNGKIFHQTCLPPSRPAPVGSEQAEDEVEITFSTKDLLTISSKLTNRNRTERLKIAHALADHKKIFSTCKECAVTKLREDMFIDESESNQTLRELSVFLTSHHDAEAARDNRYKKPKHSEIVRVFTFCSAECDKRHNAMLRGKIAEIKELLSAQKRRESTPEFIAAAAIEQENRERKARLRAAGKNAETNAKVKVTYVTTVTKTETRTKTETETETAVSVANIRDLEIPAMYHNNLQFEINREVYSLAAVEDVLENLEPETIIGVTLMNPRNGMMFKTLGSWKNEADFRTLVDIVSSIMHQTGAFR